MPLTEEERVRIRPVDHGVTGRAALVSRLRQVVEARRVGRAALFVAARDGVRVRVTLDAELEHVVAF
jgi:hypothetical protein